MKKNRLIIVIALFISMSFSACSESKTVDVAGNTYSDDSFRYEFGEDGQVYQTVLAFSEGEESESIGNYEQEGNLIYVNGEEQFKVAENYLFNHIDSEGIDVTDFKINETSIEGTKNDMTFYENGTGMCVTSAAAVGGDNRMLENFVYTKEGNGINMIFTDNEFFLYWYIDGNLMYNAYKLEQQ